MSCQLDPDRVLSEMAELGMTATDLGALGWFPEDGRGAKRVLDRCLGYGRGRWVELSRASRETQGSERQPLRHLDHLRPSSARALDCDKALL